MNEEQVEIYDEISSPNTITVERAGNMSLRHVASGKFFEKSDLIAPSEGPLLFKDICLLNYATKLSFSDGKVEVVYDRLG